jgi:two-component system phosphate regulon sensor histidine kinase PhoR
VVKGGSSDGGGWQVPLTQMIEGLTDAVVVVDERSTIVLVNAKTEERFDFTRDELVGRPIDVLLPEQLDDVQLGRRRDGNEFPVEIGLIALETDDGALVATVITDITQQGRLEAIGPSAGEIAHEFNNLLTAIMGYAGFLIRDLDEGSKAHRDALEIRAAAQRGAALTRQLLVVSQIEAVDAETDGLTAA